MVLTGLLSLAALGAALYVLLLVGSVSLHYLHGGPMPWVPDLKVKDLVAVVAVYASLRCVWGILRWLEQQISE